MTPESPFGCPIPGCPQATSRSRIGELSHISQVHRVSMQEAERLLGEQERQRRRYPQPAF